MPLFRVERQSGGEWHPVHLRVDARDERTATDYVRAVLPHTTHGQELRAIELKEGRPGQPEKRAAA